MDADVIESLVAAADGYRNAVEMLNEKVRDLEHEISGARSALESAEREKVRPLTTRAWREPDNAAEMKFSVDTGVPIIGFGSVMVADLRDAHSVALIAARMVEATLRAVGLEMSRRLATEIRATATLMGFVIPDVAAAPAEAGMSKDAGDE